MNKVKLFALVTNIVFYFSTCNSALSQTFPAFGLAYPQLEVPSINIYMPSDSLVQMILEQSDDHQYLAQFIFQSSALNDTIETAAIRLRGNSSLNAAKKSFAISFNAFNDGGDWQQVERLNLIAQQNDPSLLRSKLTHDMHRYMGVASARTSFVALYINDEYMGLYLNQEHIDEEFAKKYFDDQGDGNLYKCTYPADLDFISNNDEDYKMAPWGTRTYDLKTNEWLDDYSDLAHFIDVLNNTSLSELPCELPKLFDVDGFLRAAAVDVLSGNWDGYIYNKNNFYLYHHQLTGQFVYVPYDMDNTFGIDWVGQDWTDRNIYNWAPSSEERPLFNRLLQVDEYRDRFSFHIQMLLNDYFTEANILLLAQQWQALIEDDALLDIYRTLDYEYDGNDFLIAITENVDEPLYPHTDYSIVDYVNARAANALNDLESFDEPIAIVHWLASEGIVSSQSDEVRIAAHIINDSGVECSLMLSTDNINYSEATDFNDNGLTGDEFAGDGVYTYTGLPPAGNKLYYKVACSDGSEFPCDDAYFMWLTPVAPGLYINEVMTQNDNSITDEMEEHADWLELWNGTASATTLNGKYLTDNLSDWNKFPMPDIAIASNEFLICWLDNEQEQGNLHATFKMGGNDNNLYLLTVLEGEPRMVSAFWPCISQADYSQERVTDGGNLIAATNAPTPYLSNMFVGVSEQIQLGVSVFPNPAHDQLYFSEQLADVSITDAMGRIVKRATNCNQLDVSSLERGIYVVRMNHIIVQTIILY